MRRRSARAACAMRRGLPPPPCAGAAAAAGAAAGGGAIRDAPPAADAVHPRHCAAAFIHPHLWMRFLRCARATGAAVVVASMAATCRPLAAPARASAILFDHTYSRSGTSSLWDAVGLKPSTTGGAPQPPAPAPAHVDEGAKPPKAKGKRKRGVPRRVPVEDEIRVLQRLVVATCVGGMIGLERRSAKSFAGVRTFSLVSLGAAIFMSTMMVAFPAADPARIAAAVSSSVGFIGGGVLSKDRPSSGGGSKQSRGLTTAASVWLAAGLGLAAACGLFVMAFVGSLLVVTIARYARFDNDLQWIKNGDPLADRTFDDDDERLETPHVAGNGSPPSAARNGGL